MFNFRDNPVISTLVDGASTLTLLGLNLRITIDDHNLISYTQDVNTPSSETDLTLYCIRSEFGTFVFVFHLTMFPDGNEIM
jgi:hypothetical protein